MESIIGALNALILNRLVTRVNTGQGKNIPVSIIVDELPALYFHKIDRLIGTARSNKVSVALGFQELPQLESDYGKVGMQKVITTVGNVVSGSARAKETLEWLSNDIFGMVVQLKKGVTIDRDKTSINLNENMDSLVPVSKISDMPTGWIYGQSARDFIKTKTGRGDSMNIQKSAEFQTSKFYCKTDFDMKKIAEEEADYANYKIPKFYTFPSKDVEALRGIERGSQYDAKKRGQTLSAVDMGFYRHKALPTNRTPYLIDNVVDTGNTAKAAIRALGCGTVASFAMSDTLLQREETRSLRR